jgi:hypothetical protein
MPTVATVTIEYPISAHQATRIGGNVKRKLIEDFLAEYIHSIAGDGKTDDREPEDREVYHLKLSCDLSYDAFTLTHDCGNNSMAVGIITVTLGRLLEGDERVILPPVEKEADSTMPKTRRAKERAVRPKTRPKAPRGRSEAVRRAGEARKGASHGLG